MKFDLATFGMTTCVSCLHSLTEVRPHGAKRFFCVLLQNRKMVGLDEIPVERSFSCRRYKPRPRNKESRVRPGPMYLAPLKVYPKLYTDPPMPGTKYASTPTAVRL